MKRACWAVALLFTAGTAAAHQAQKNPTDDSKPAVDPYAEFDFADLDIETVLGEVTAASAKSESLFVAPATVTVLNGDDIRLTAATSIPDLLRSVPGVQVVRVAPANYAVSLRGTGGLQSNNLIIVLDGVSMNDPFDGNVDWAAFPATLDDVERVEVVRGPVSPIYGADAFTGVVVITTRTPGSRDRWRLNAGVGGGTSFDRTPSGNGFVALAHGGTASWRLSLHGSHDETLSRFVTETPLRQEIGHHSPAQATGAVGRLDLQLSDHVKLNVATGASWSEASALDSLVLSTAAQQSSSAHLGTRLVLDRLAGSAHALTLSASARYLALHANTKDYNSTFSYAKTASYRARASAALALLLADNLTLHLGLESGVLNVDAPFIHPDENNTLRAGHAARVDADLKLLGMFLLEAAVRGDWSAFTRHPEASARASIVFYQESYSLRASAGSAYRNPTYVELAGRFIDPQTDIIQLEGSSHLQAPRSNSAELAGIFGFSAAHLMLRPTLFFQQLVNLVVGDFEPLVHKTFRNDRRAIEMVGAELEADWDTSRWFTLHATGTMLRFLTDQDDPSATIGEEHHNARLSGRLEGRLHLLGDSLTISAAASYIGGRKYDVRAGIPPQLLPVYKVPAMQRLETGIEWQPAKTFPVLVQLKGMLIFPTSAREAAYPNSAQLGPSLYAGVQYRPL